MENDDFDNDPDILEARRRFRDAISRRIDAGDDPFAGNDDDDESEAAKKLRESEARGMRSWNEARENEQKAETWKFIAGIALAFIAWLVIGTIFGTGD